jgi:hypothetical protein
MSLTITGLIIAVLSQFIPAEEAQTIVEALGIIVAFYGRVRLGDLTWFGLRK